jgi:hypothetical protein
VHGLPRRGAAHAGGVARAFAAHAVVPAVPPQRAGPAGPHCSRRPCWR